jgi:hypothetical protein
VRRKTVNAVVRNKKVRVPVNFGRYAPVLIGRQVIFQTLRTTGFNVTE